MWFGPRVLTVKKGMQKYTTGETNKNPLELD